MNDNKSKLQRRHFLLTVGAAGAAATAAVIAGTPSVTTQASADDKRGGKGYKETAHVRNYYRTTLV